MSESVYERFERHLMDAITNPNEKERFASFRKAMMVRAEIAARDQVSVNDTCLLHALRGQNTILFELADWAGQALEAAKAKANAEAAERIPDALK